MKIFILALLVTTTNVCFSQYWSSATPYDDPNESVLAIEVHNGEIYIGGAFSQVGGILASHIAKWDGTTWSTVGSGLSGYPSHLHSSNGILYAIANGLLYYFDGTDWVNSNIPLATVFGISTYGSGIMISTNFGVYVGSSSTYNLFAPNNLFTCFKEFNGELYGGGSSGLFKWDGVVWQDVTGGNSAIPWWAFQINDLDVFDNKLVVAGFFSGIGGLTLSNIAFFDGTNYSEVGTNLANLVIAGEFNDLEVYNNKLFATGSFFSSNYRFVARFDSNDWNIVDNYYFISGVTSGNDIEFYNSELYVGISGGTLGARNFLKFNNFSF